MPLTDAALHRYCVYGVTIASDRPLPLPLHGQGDLGCIECTTAPADFFEAARQKATRDSRGGPWYEYRLLEDGSTYVRWHDVGEFVIDAAGHHLQCRRERKAADESFDVYLLGQALSFALIKQRLEPLHATAVTLGDGRAVAFLGNNAFGKSSLAASFIAAGCRLITDDLLIVRSTASGTVAYPGPPRIKLFSKIARHVLGSSPTGVPMNGDTDKLVLPVDAERRCADPVRLTAIYALVAPRDACREREVSIQMLSRRDAFVALVGAMFNRLLLDARRLTTQFALTSDIAARVPVKRLVHPRTLAHLDAVRRAVMVDLGS